MCKCLLVEEMIIDLDLGVCSKVVGQQHHRNIHVTQLVNLSTNNNKKPYNMLHIISRKPYNWIRQFGVKHSYRVIYAPHEHAQYRFVGPEQFHLLVFYAEMLLLDHDATAKEHFVWFWVYLGGENYPVLVNINNEQILKRIKTDDDQGTAVEFAVCTRRAFFFLAPSADNWWPSCTCMHSVCVTIQVCFHSENICWRSCGWLLFWQPHIVLKMLQGTPRGGRSNHKQRRVHL